MAKEKRKLFGVVGPQIAAGAIEWMSAEINNYLYTHAIKVFAGVWGWLFSKSTPTKNERMSAQTSPRLAPPQAAFFKKFLWSPKAKKGV